MRIVVTGGGTGGHVYPALEVAKAAVSEGQEVRYLGSLRGIERSACEHAGVSFTGYPSSPIPRLVSPAGLVSAYRILRSSAAVRQDLKKWKPDVVLSMGGYAASPVLTAARWMRLPLVLHEQNSVPGRTNLMAAGAARKVCIVFAEAEAYFPGKSVVTGMPIRSGLLDVVRHAAGRETFFTLSYGGSQGSAALNEAILTMAAQVGTQDLTWLQITGPKLFEEVAKALERVCAPPNFQARAFLQADEIAAAYERADLAIVRSGCGTITELASFGVPAIFVPLPQAYANHQYHNAKAIEGIGGGEVLLQKDLTPESLRAAWQGWRSDAERRRQAADALQAWSRRDGTQRVLSVVKEVANAVKI
ncbi:MAG: undecaprenyldiphospho-muramoylpentapeptide beta-N-acetylglucosaminyltransferase [Fimbriimonadales bacterium]